MRLILVRHAEAVPLEADGVASDFHRPLTEHGKAQAAALAAVLRDRGVFPQAILTSPLVRAVETAEPLLRELLPGRAYIVTERLVPDDLKPKKLSKLAVEQGGDAVMLVGHMPSIADYAAWLLDAEAGAVAFDKAGAMCVDCPHVVARGGGRLEWLVSPAWFMPSS